MQSCTALFPLAFLDFCPERKVLMKKRTSQLLTGLLAAAMLGSLPLSAFADDTDIAYDAELTFNGSSISVSDGAAGVSVSGTTVTISQSGSYYFTGTLTDGQILVNVNKTTYTETTKLYFDNVDITGVSAPAVFVTCAENTSINLVEGSENYIRDGETYAANSVIGTNYAAIFANDDLTIKGSGTLNVLAQYQYGIHCANDLKLTEGTVLVDTSRDVATDMEDAIRAKDSITVKEPASITIDSDGDGLKSTKANVEIQGGTLNIKASNDAIQAETAILISGGSVTAGGDRGLRCDVADSIQITGGTVLATATDYQASNLMDGQKTLFLSYAEEQLKDSEIALLQDTLAVYSMTSSKKFTYALLSSATIPDTTVQLLTGDLFMYHDADSSGSFDLSGNTFSGITALEVQPSTETTETLTTESETDATEEGSDTDSTEETDATEPTDPEEFSGLWGDVNGDGLVDSDDAVLVLKQYTAEMLQSGSLLGEGQKTVADTNEDGAIDSDDAVAILKYYVASMLG